MWLLNNILITPFHFQTVLISPLLPTSWPINAILNSHDHQHFITCSPHNMPLKRNLSSSLFLNHVLITNWTAACSPKQLCHILLNTYCLPYIRLPENVKPTYSLWKWQLQCLPKRLINFNIQCTPIPESLSFTLNSSSGNLRTSIFFKISVWNTY